MTELIEPDADDVVLEVGTGSGYQAAILAEIAYRVYTVERIHPLLLQARDLGVHRVVFKPFRAVGAARGAARLTLERAGYTAAIEAAVERWPEEAPEAEFSDGAPVGLPAWTRRHSPAPSRRTRSMARSTRS